MQKEEKEFRKAQRMIYKTVNANPKKTALEMPINIGASEQQTIKRLTELNPIIREGGRRNGSRKIIDKESYQGKNKKSPSDSQEVQTP